MKNEKAFTLIELLTVVIILGILLALALPAIHSYLIRGTKEYYHSLEETVKESGKDYLNDYRALLPREIGNVTVIELKELTSNNYIKNVVDSNNKACDARVTAKKTGKNEYEYYSCLDCGSSYQTEGEACSFSEDNNITTDTKNYEIKVDSGSYDVEADGVYIVNQGANFTLPLGKAYYKGQLVSDKVEPKPKTIDTNKLGTTKVTYVYQGARASITVKVVDRVAPSVPQVVLRKNNSTGNIYTGGWYSGDIYQEYLSTDYSKPGIMGSGVKEYQISTDNKTFTTLSRNNQITTVNGSYTYYVKSVDKSGNIGNSNTYSFKIDKEVPTCSLKVTSGTPGTNGWYTSNATVGFGNITEKVSSIVYQNINIPSVTSNGKTTVMGMVMDEAGNIGTCSIDVYVDKKAPTCSFTNESTTWTNSNRTITAICSDGISGCTNDTASKSWNFTSGTVKNSNLSYTIIDNAGNSTTCSKTANVYVDKEGPTTPTNGAIGNVSGSNSTGNIQTLAGGSTDTGVGNISYKYIISASSTTPSNADSRFSTSTIFTRSCGTSYYAWVVAEDGLGNRSGVKYLGVTSDGANSYSAWGSCSKTCGSGTQTRTNSCALITANLSQSCNTQSCCPYLPGQTWEFGYTGANQPFEVPCTGAYKLESYGAQGGHYSSYIGGLGGFTSSNFNLTTNDVLNIYVGGQNGFGYDTNGTGSTSDSNGSVGGGATEILLSRNNTSNILQIAGGGGGANRDFNGGLGGSSPSTTAGTSGGGGGGYQHGQLGKLTTPDNPFLYWNPQYNEDGTAKYWKHNKWQPDSTDDRNWAINTSRKDSFTRYTNIDEDLYREGFKDLTAYAQYDAGGTLEVFSGYFDISNTKSIIYSAHIDVADVYRDENSENATDLDPNWDPLDINNSYFLLVDQNDHELERITVSQIQNGMAGTSVGYFHNEKSDSGESFGYYHDMYNVTNKVYNITSGVTKVGLHVVMKFNSVKNDNQWKNTGVSINGFYGSNNGYASTGGSSYINSSFGSSNQNYQSGIREGNGYTKITLLSHQ